MKWLCVCAFSAVVLAQQFPPVRPPTGPGRGGGTQGGGTGTGGQQLPPRPMSARERSATADAIERYVKGDHEKSLVTLGNIGGFDVMNAEEWIVSGGAGAVQNRRLIAAIVALEYTASRTTLSPSLFEWGAKTLAASVEPQPAEALWLRASIALAEGRDAWPILMGLPPGYSLRPMTPPVGGAARTAVATPPDPLLGHGHLAYALSRFPDDPYFKLAQVVAVEASTSPTAGAIVLAPDGKAVVADQLDAQMRGPSSPSATSPPALLERAAGLAATLGSDALVGPEAHLRLGYIQLRLGHHDLALAQFTQIQTTDPFVGYLGHMFSGWTLARDGQADAAVAAYRAALGVVPHARSVSTLLTTLCLMNGRQDDAEQLANELMTKPAVADDPWRGYLLGDYREYPKLIARLREAIQ